MSNAGDSSTTPPPPPRAESSSSRPNPLDGFRRPIDAPQLSAFYRLGLLLVLGLLVLLPLIYFALVGAVGWLVYWHATQNVGILYERGRMVGKTLTYLGPLAAGLIVLLFLIKPVLAPVESIAGPVILTKDKEPLLFAFIARLCRLVGAPMPTEIAVDCQANASASFRRGVWSFASQDLTLTIGLPLVAGLTLQELTGVLAHEFGHFAQRTGMRATFLIRTINAWFARVVYERDDWDRRLDRWGRIDFRITIVIWVAKAGIWIGRGALWCLMHVGHVCSCFMLRQMEYDADRYEIDVAGSEVFTRTSQKLPLLGVALGRAMGDAHHGWRSKRLPDDLSALAFHRYQALDRDDCAHILDVVSQRKTGLFDTHPADVDRIAAAAVANQPGAFAFDGPATQLFTDFNSLSRLATVAYYRDTAGLSVDESLLVSADRAVSEDAAERALINAPQQFFGGAVSVYRPFSFRAELVAQPVNIRQTLQKYASARAAVKAMGDAAKGANQGFHDTLGDRHTIERAGLLIKHKISIPPKDWLLDAATSDAVQQAIGRLHHRFNKHRALLAEFDRQAQVSLLSALQVVHTSGATAGPFTPVREDLERLLPVFICVATMVNELFDLSVRCATLETAFELAQRQGEMNRDVSQLIAATVEAMTPLLQTVEPMCGDLKYPFAHGGTEVSLARYLLGDDRHEDQVIRTFVQARRLTDALPDLYLRLLGRFVQMTTIVEDRLADQVPPDLRSVLLD